MLIFIYIKFIKIQKTILQSLKSRIQLLTKIAYFQWGQLISLSGYWMPLTTCSILSEEFLNSFEKIHNSWVLVQNRKNRFVNYNRSEVTWGSLSVFTKFIFYKCTVFLLLLVVRYAKEKNNRQTLPI